VVAVNTECRRVIIIAMLICTILLGGCSNSKMDEKHKKVLLLGIDGADPRVLTKLMDEGKLPNFAKLRDSGTFKPLKTSMPPHSPVAWTTIATGTNPGKHNIFDFISRDPKTYLPALALSKTTTTHLGGTNYESIITADPFWRVSSKDKIPTSILRWPVTFPPEKVEGNLLSGLGVPDVRGLLSGYSYYTTEDIKASSGPENIVKVNVKDSFIETVISGPRKVQGGKRVDITEGMNISISDNKITIKVNKAEYNVQQGEWSDWIRVKFKVGLLKEVSGITKAHLISIDPFKLYLTAIQINPEKPLYEISYPKDYSAKLAGEVGLFHTLGIAEDTGALNEKRIDEETFLEQTSQIEEEREKIFWSEFSNFKKNNAGVMAFVFDSIDRVQHMFWEEDVFEGTLNISPHVVAYFEKKDKFLGKVLDEIGADTSLIIVSDHGFSSFQRAVSVNRWLVDNEFMVLTEEPGDGDDGGLFKYVDWSKTKAYSLGFNSIYINLEGREAKGIVKSEEKEKVAEELMEKFLQFTDSKTDKKPVYKLYRSEDIYSGSQLKNSPDIMIGYYPGYRTSWQTAIGGLTKELIFDNEKHWKADHLIDSSFVPGILLANFKIAKEEPEQKDIAPTALTLLGAEIPEDMDGESLLK